MKSRPCTTHFERLCFNPYLTPHLQKVSVPPLALPTLIRILRGTVLSLCIMSSTEDNSSKAQEASYGEAPGPLSPRAEDAQAEQELPSPSQQQAPRILLPLHKGPCKALQGHKARSSESSIASDSTAVSPRSSTMGLLPGKLHSRSSSISDALYRDPVPADGHLSPVSSGSRL